MFLRTVFSLLLVASLTSLSFAQEKVRKAKITTPFGDMIVKLHNDTPLHRDNFINYAEKGWFDQTLFHRVIPFFMAQGGDPNSVGAASDRVLGSDRCAKIPNEIRRHYFHKKGTLAAARLADGINPTKESSACQFFIVKGYKLNDAQLNSMETENFQFSDMARAYYKTVGGYPPLDMNYTIFGEVIEGIEIIDLITNMPTGEHVTDRPNTDIMMKVEMIN